MCVIQQSNSETKQLTEWKSEQSEEKNVMSDKNNNNNIVI